MSTVTVYLLGAASLSDGDLTISAISEPSGFRWGTERFTVGQHINIANQPASYGICIFNGSGNLQMTVESNYNGSSQSSTLNIAPNGTGSSDEISPGTLVIQRTQDLPNAQQFNWQPG